MLGVKAPDVKELNCHLLEALCCLYSLNPQSSASRASHSYLFKKNMMVFAYKLFCVLLSK